jgi:hypothetical protein
MSFEHFTGEEHAQIGNHERMCLSAYVSTIRYCGTNLDEINYWRLL